MTDSIDPSQDPRVQAIRNQTALTNTNVDECYGNDDLVEYLDNEGVTTPKEAVEWAFDEAVEWAYRMADYEVGGDCTEGQDLASRLLKALEEFKKQ